MKALIACIAAVLALGAGQALAAGHLATPRTLPVVMHDPGCHWFLIQGKDAKTASLAGPIQLKNLDMNTLKVASRRGLRLVRVGKSILLTRGNYVVMMVGQAVDDNYLTLTVR